MAPARNSTSRTAHDRRLAWRYSVQSRPGLSPVPDAGLADLNRADRKTASRAAPRNSAMRGSTSARSLARPSNLDNMIFMAGILMRRPAGNAKRREDKGKIERQQLDHIRKIVFVPRAIRGQGFSDAMAQPKIGTTGLKSTPQQIILGATHTSGVRLEIGTASFEGREAIENPFPFFVHNFLSGSGIFFEKQCPRQTPKRC